MVYNIDNSDKLACHVSSSERKVYPVFPTLERPLTLSDSQERFLLSNQLSDFPLNNT